MLPQPESNVRDEELISDFEAARYASGDTPGQKTPRNGSRTAKKRESGALSIELRSNRSSKIRENSIVTPKIPLRGQPRGSVMVTPKIPLRGRPRGSVMVTQSVSRELDGLVLSRRKTNNSIAIDSTLEGDVDSSGMDTTVEEEDAVESGMDEEVAGLMSEETRAAEHMLQIKFVFFKLVEYFILFILFSLLSFRR